MRRTFLLLASAVLAALLVCSVGLLGVAAGEARAAYPGKNGKIAFVSGGQIHTVDDDGSDQKALASGSQPAWSPDGARMAFAAPGGGISVMNADGSGVAPVSASGDSPTWSPDGTKIAFIDAREAPNANGVEYQEVYVMDADGSDVTRLTDFNNDPETPADSVAWKISDLAWSPDGSKMAFEMAVAEEYGSYYTRTWIMDSDGSDRRDAFEGANPSWSPDGTKIAAGAFDGNGWDGIYVADLATPANSDFLDIQAGLYKGLFIYGNEPVWSPDGFGLAFVASGDISDGIYTVSSSSGYNRQQMALGGSDPDWQTVSTDASAPNTFLASGPAGLVKTASASFALRSTEQGPTTYQCRLDGAPFSVCTSPRAYSNLTDGAHSFEVKAADSEGNTDPTPVRRTWTVDTTSPVATAPAQSLVANTTLGTPTVPARLTWSASDSGSGVAGYQLQESVNGSPFADVPLPTALTTAIDRPLEPSKNYRYQVRARDKAGKLSAWKTGPSFAVDVRQEDHQALTYTGAWPLQAASSASGGYTKYAGTSGAKARFAFAGRNVSWVAPKGPDKGKAEVWVDGTKAATVDLYASSAQPRTTVFTKSWSTSTSHTLEVRVLGTKNASSSGKRVDADAFVALR